MTEPNREKQIFEAALDLPSAAERHAYVIGACAGDPALATRVMALLAAHGTAAGFLPEDQAARGEGSGERDGAHGVEGPGTVIDRYRLLEPIGEGGFGVVYLAEQTEPVRRRVALKIIKPGMDSKQVIARFEAERQALAMMDHPNIAQVHDAGATPSGRPYFVMELVQGIPVTDFCREQKLDLRDRLNLLVDVCGAVQHAHQKGIIHRDLKPTNVLVTLHGDRPVPKVIDFGIAKATAQPLTERTLFTQFQQFLGTPAYMSPEQASLSGLDVDTRSDVYSLGVLLYELLTGSPPFATDRLLGAGLDEMRRILREEDPPRPSTRLSQSRQQPGTAGRVAPPSPELKVASELDWIVLKALEKDRDRRYETASGLAADLRRHLADEPVTAVAPTLRYQLGKFYRRHRAVARTAAGFGLVLAFATVASIAQAVRASRAESAARDRTTESEAITAFLESVFRSPAPGRDGRKVTVLELLDRGAARLDEELAGQPLPKARLQLTLGTTYRELGRFTEAVPLLEAARAFFMTRLGTEDETRESEAELARAYFGAGRYGDAIPLFESRLAALREERGDGAPETANAANALAAALMAVGRDDEAMRLMVRQAAAPGDATGIPGSFQHLLDQAETFHAVGRHREALDLQIKAVAGLKETFGLEHAATLGAMLELGRAWSSVGQWQKALDVYLEAVSPFTRVFSNHPKQLELFDEVGRCFRWLFTLDDCIQQQTMVHRESIALLGPDHPLTLTRGDTLADSLDAAGRTADALDVRSGSLATRRAVFGGEFPDSPSLGDDHGLFAMTTTTFRVAAARLALGDRDDATNELDRTRELVADWEAPTGARVPDALVQMFRDAAHAAVGEGQLETAVVWFGRALALDLPDEQLASMAAIRERLLSALIELDDRTAIEGISRPLFAQTAGAANFFSFQGAAEACLVAGPPLAPDVLDAARMAARRTHELLAPPNVQQVDPYGLVLAGLAAFRSDDPNGAGELLARSLAEPIRAGSAAYRAGIRAKTHAYLAIVRAAQGRRDDALTHYSTAHGWLERRRAAGVGRRPDTACPGVDPRLAIAAARSALGVEDGAAWSPEMRDARLRVVRADPSDTRLAYQTALALHATGDATRHRELCTALVERASTTRDPDDIARAASAVLVDRGSDPSLGERIGKLADETLAPLEGALPSLDWFRLVLAMLRIRDQGFDDAASWLSRSRDTLMPSGDTVEPATFKLVEAWIAALRGDEESAARVLDEARPLLPELPEGLDLGELFAIDPGRLFTGLIHREVAELVPPAR